ncbi:MAG: 4Fe-4S binding protein [Chloroflexota bacterium]
MTSSPERHHKLKPVAPGAGKWWDIEHIRYLVQTGFAVFIAVLIYNRAVSDLSGPSAPTSPEAYCPLGGFETLYKYVTSGGQFISHAHLSNLVLFVAVLVTAVFAKSFFCGWICPLGAIQQAITGFRRWVQKRVSALGCIAIWLGRQTKPAAFLDRWFRYAKYLVLAWIIWGTVTYGEMVFRDVDPWAALLNIVESQSGIGFWVLIGTLVVSLFGDRPWCRYLCPLGAIIGVVGKLSFVKVQRESSVCIGCKWCTRECPMDLPVHAKSRVAAVECNMCLSCVDACPAGGALELRFSLLGTKHEGAQPEKVKP